MFKLCSIPLASSELRVFVGGDPVDAFALTSDLASSLGMQTPSIRSQISKHTLDKLISLPALKKHLIQEGVVSGGKLRFAKSSTWSKLVEARVSSEQWKLARKTLTEALAAAENALSNSNDSESDSQSGKANASCTHDKGKATDSGDEIEEDAAFDSPFVDQDAGEKGFEDDEYTPVKDGNDSLGNDSFGDYIGTSDSGGGGGGGGSASDSDSGSDSSSVAPSDILPVGAPEWVLTEPILPKRQFSTRDYSKSYALKSYDMRSSLKKSLKKLGKWWMKPRNSERVGKSVQQATLDKRQERVLCFLGFVSRYKCLPEGRDLCLELCFNHKLFGVYLEYLEKVRKSAPGTITEAITSVIFVCKWLYRKTGSSESSVVRRYKDWRNDYQNQAQRSRKMVDQEDLEERGQWLEWSEFTNLISKLKLEWEIVGESNASSPNVQNAHILHDLLLLGLYSCIPARGAEVRLLQYIPEQELAELRNGKSVKQFVESQHMNIISQINGTWKMVLSDYKNVRSHGIDSTNLTPHFQWWTNFLELYLKQYRPLIVRHQDNHRYVFVTRSGEPFTSSYFSDFISSLLLRHTGKRVATNGLRSSFVTSFYNSKAADDPEVRESVANVMRHSVSEARRTYDRRSGTSKKRKGLDLLALVASSSDAVSAPKKQNTSDADELAATELVVEHKRAVFNVIREENNQYQLAKMQRLPNSNTPVYFVSLNAVYEWKPKAECNRVDGTWDQTSGEFLLN